MLFDLTNTLRGGLFSTSTLTQTTTFNGQTLSNGFFQNTEVQDAPAFVLANDFSNFLNFGQVTTNNSAAAVQSQGFGNTIFNFPFASIQANNGPDVFDATGIQVTGSADVFNFGQISGDFNGIEFLTGGGFNSGATGFNNPVFGNGSNQSLSVLNFGTINGDEGAGIDVQVGDDVIEVVDGIDEEPAQTQPVDDSQVVNIEGEGDATVDIVNIGLISSDSPTGTAGGVRIADGVNADGRVFNTAAGTIDGVSNGIYIGDGEHDLNILNRGTIQSDSRAVNIDGTGVELTNEGDILGTGNQRNGTVYADGTADDFEVINRANGVIDAGEGNEGSGFGVEIGGADDGANTFTLDNAGTIQGRGNASAGSPLAGDGVRVGNVGNIGVTDAEITNTGTIASEGANGTVAGVRFVNGVSFQGEFDNSGDISGVQNGVYFGNPVDGQGADHTGGVFNNLEGGTISSDSRAFNIDGIGLEVNNAGEILGTGNQRNGTVYADGTAQDFTFNNQVSGVVDAGEGNQGSGFGAEIAGQNSFTLTNEGTIQGRGDAIASDPLAGDGIRIGNVGNVGTFDGTITNSGTVASEGTDGTVGAFRSVNNINFQGELINEEDGVFEGGQNGVYFGTGDHTGGSFVNRGTVTSDSRALNIDGNGLAVVNEGDILGTGNQRNGTVYADGTADNFSFSNSGTVDAGDGNNGSAVSLQIGDESGDIVAATVINEEGGVFQGRGDAEVGNQVGDGLRLFSNEENASLAGAVTNAGLIAGSDTSDAAAGLRVDGGLNVLGPIRNAGEIRGNVNAIDASDAGDVTIVNEDDGVINGNVLLSDGDDIFVDLGLTNGDIVAGAGDDVIIAGDADDVVTGGLGDDFIDGGDGFDTADFSDLDVAVKVVLDENGNGSVTRDTGFTITTDPVVIPDGPGASVQPTNVVDAASFVEEALAGNFYFNLHTSDVIGGEIRGQLDTIVSDEVENGVRTIVLTGDVDSDQEVGTGSESDATGTGTVVIFVDEATGEVSYSSELTVVGLNEADLQTPAPGVASAIHLHNAPAGSNGPIVRDTLVDAGAEVDAGVPAGAGGADVFENQVEVDILSSIERVIGSEDADTIDLSEFDGVRIDLDVNTPQPGPASQDGVIQVDGETVVDIVDFENVLGSDGDDLILGNNEINVLEGLGGNDSIHSFGGADTIDGGEGSDTALFSAGAGVVVDLDEDGNAIAEVNAEGGAVLDTVLNFENINGSNNTDSPNGGNDILSGNSSSNVLNGQAGDDILIGEGGNDILIGGDGHDTFVFDGLFGDDEIQDFDLEDDALDFGDFEGDVVAIQDGDDAVITLADQGSVRLIDVNADEFNGEFV